MDLVIDGGRSGCRAALYQGDRLAGSIWDDAAAELAASALAAARAVAAPGQRLPVSWTGGLFAARDLLLEPFLARLRATGGVVTAAPLGTALDGGRLLAQASLRPPFDALVRQDAVPRSAGPW